MLHKWTKRQLKMEAEDKETEIEGYEKRKRNWKKLLAMTVLAVCFFSLALAGSIRYYQYYLAPGWHVREEGRCYRVKGEKGYAVGVQEIDGQLYCFDAEGWLMYGWILYANHIYYADGSGVLAKGELDLDGKIHHFDPETGVLLVGWQEEEGVRRYLQEDGTFAVGYREIDGIPYKFLENGIPYFGMDETKDGIKLFTENGLAEGITAFQGDTYYFVDGYMQYGLLPIEDHWYYFAEDGTMQRGWLTLEEKKYYFGEAGAKLTGTQTIEGEIYCLAEDGELISGWVETGDGRYYYSDHGEKLTGTQVIEGETYYLGEDGKLNRGWVTDGAATYYYSNGQKVTGWQTIDNKRYYFQNDGTMAVNTTIEIYQIDSSGVAWKMPASPENLNWYLDEILDSYGRSPSAIHKAVHSLLSYKSTKEGSIEQMACDAINNRRGACWNYSSLGYMLLQRAGYGVYYISGTYLPNGNPHRWLYVEFDDGWYYMDCLHNDRLKLTDEQYAALKFEWDRTGLPGY